MAPVSRRALTWKLFGFVLFASSFLAPSPLFAQFGGGGSPPPPPPPTPSKFDPLVRVIETTIQPDSWGKVGGPGSIEGVDAWGLVIVSQTEEIHEQIEHLILVVREARREQQAASGTTSDREEKKEKHEGKSVSRVVESRSKAAARKKIEAALNSETTFDFVESPLVEVVDLIKRLHGIEVQLDTRALDGVGIGGDTPLTRKLSGVTLRSALRLILRDLDLTYMIRDEVLMITTPEEAESELVTRAYLVEDLAVPLKE